MALSTDEKGMAIYQLSKIITDAKDDGGVSNLGEIDTDIAALKTAFAANPSTVTAAALNALKNKVTLCKFSSVNSSTSLWTEVATEAG